MRVMVIEAAAMLALDTGSSSELEVFPCHAMQAAVNE